MNSHIQRQLTGTAVRRRSALPLSEISARQLYDAIVRDLHTWRDVSLFLGGGPTSATDCLRQRLREGIRKEKRRGWWYRFQVLYAEDLFEGILYGPKPTDLLTLENLLADSVDCIVLVVESAGAICELGAFVNHEALQDRVLAVVDEKYRNHRSFIASGPVRYLAEGDPDQVIQWDFRRSDSEPLVESVLDSAIEISRARRSSGEAPSPRGNLVVAMRFVLFALYLFDQVGIWDLGPTLENVLDLPADESGLVARAAIDGLCSERNIAKEGEEYVLTPEGIGVLGDLIDQAYHPTVLRRTLDRLRVEYLNKALREVS